MARTGDRDLASTLSVAGFLQLTKCTRIIKRRAEATTRRFLNLSVREVWVLLAANCAQPVTQKQIATHVSLNQNLIVQLIDKLEQSGHVQRVRNPANRREHFVRLTRKGTAAAHRLLANRDAYYRIILAPFDDALIHTILGQLYP